MGHVSRKQQARHVRRARSCSIVEVRSKKEGGQSAFAKNHGTNRVRVNKLLSGKAHAGDAVAKVLGLRKVYVAE
jgi:hypothetical protein